MNWQQYCEETIHLNYILNAPQTNKMGDSHAVFDLEDFSLFLAANLLGGKAALEAQLQKHSTSQQQCGGGCLPLYWRSPLLMDPNSIGASTWMPAAPTSSSKIQSTQGGDSSIIPPRTENNNDMELDVVFVDVTFSFLPLLPDNDNDNDNDNHSTVAFGAFLRRRNITTTTINNDTYFYIKGPAVTQRFLHDHMDQHNTVLEETKSFVISKHMAQALRQIPPNTSVKTANATILQQDPQHTSDSSSHQHETNMTMGLRQVDIPLLYDDGAETSLLSIVNSSGIFASPLDKNVASTWLCGLLSQNMANNDGDDPQQDNGSKAPSWKPVGTTEDAKQLRRTFEEWKQFHVDERARQQESEAKVVGGNSHEDDQGAATTAAGVASPAKPQPNSTATNLSQSTPSPGKTSNKNKLKVVRPRPMGMRVGGMKKKKAKTKNKFSSAGNK